VKFSLFFIILFVIGNASGFSLDFTFSNSDFSSGETAQLEIIVNGTLEEDLKNENLNLICSDQNVEFVHNLLKIDDSTYYSFFNLGNLDVGNCTLFFEDVIYYEGGFLKQKDFSTNFNLIESNKTSIYVDPAGIVFENFNLQNFIQLNIFNSNLIDIPISITSDLDFIEFDVENFILSTEEFFNIELYFSEFVYDGEEKGSVFLEYDNNTFTIPIWINIDYSPEPELDDDEILIPVVGKNIEILQGFDGFDLTIVSSEDKSGYVLIKNLGENIELVEFKLSGDVLEIVDLQNDKLENFNSGDKFREYIYVNQDKTAEIGNYTGYLEIHYDGEIIKLPILIKIEKIFIGQTIINDTVIPGKEKEGDGINVWILVLLFIILAGAILFLIYKKKTKKSKNFLKHV
jgi:hypothetical protein